jgi:2-amino-4-hydroxy-6-hydroxymethyldihydropteridine diphosphokinase
MMKGSGSEGERVFIGFGSNQGDRWLHMVRALEALGKAPGVELVRTSSLYRTEPVGYNDQEDFFNGVAEVRTSLSPRELLRTLKGIEKDLGRKSGGRRWGPRTIDLDLLLYGSRVVRSGELTIPHPEMHRRRFVMVPLAEIGPEVSHPELGLTAAEILDGLADDKKVSGLGKWTGA